MNYNSIKLVVLWVDPINCINSLHTLVSISFFLWGIVNPNISVMWSIIIVFWKKKNFVGLLKFTEEEQSQRHTKRL